MTQPFHIFAIRLRNTNSYLPQISYHRGYSNYEPEPLGGKLGPRWFQTRRRAEHALTAWLMGRWVRTLYRSRSMWEDDDDERLTLEKVPGRKREAMEIVDFCCMEFIEITKVTEGSG